MKKIIATTLFAVLVSISANAQESLKKVYNEETDPIEQIDKAIVEAKSSSKHVICQVGGNWCPWCLRFADFITKDDSISRLVNENFVYIHVNYHPQKSDSEEKARRTATMMRRLGNPARFGFPVFVVLDGDGRVIHIQDSSFLEEGKSYNKEKVLRFFSNWTSKAIENPK